MRFDLFSSGRLYKALKEAGYPDLPAERTLRDWITNDSAPNGARLFVAELLELDTEKEPPGWAEGLATKEDLEKMIAESIIPVVARQVVSSLREAGLLPPVAPVHDNED